MAKIGILSMQRIINYGSFLQAYALKTILEEMGHEVQFADYRVGVPLIEDKGSNKKGFARKIAKVLQALSCDAPLSHRVQFVLHKTQFSKKYHPILGLTEEPNYTPEVDVLVIGSDEVFNCIQQNTNVGYSVELFGAHNRAEKLISYAASWGNTTLEKLERFHKSAELADLLKKFHAISVRDKNSASIIRKLTGKDVEFHVDPVLAYDYMKKCNRIPKIEAKEKYLILYAYSGRISKEEAAWITKYAKQKSLKVYSIGGIQRCADKFIDCSPFEVLAYFQHAEEIITDTFHGTIFSIITEKKFVTLVRKSVGSSYGNEEKLSDLLERFELCERMTYDIEAVSDIQAAEIDYEKVECRLREERKKTREYFEREIDK